MRKSTIFLLISILCVLFCSGERTTAAPSWPPEFSLEVQIGNNIWSLDKLYTPVSEEEVLKLQNIPPVLLARETLGFRLPLKQKNEWEWGFSYLQTGWVQVTGESAEFYRDALENTEPRRYYDLGFSGQRYNRQGLYMVRRWEQAGFELVVKGDLFLCRNYQEWKGSGLGRLATNADGSRSTGIYGVYSEFLREKDEAPGIGAALAWEARVRWVSGAGMELRLANLPGLVWFSRLTKDTKKVDSEGESLGPVHVTGKKERETTGIHLPLEATAIFFQPAGSGLFFFTATATGMVRDFSAGYHYPVNEKNTLIAEFNPVMRHLALGWSGPWGNLRLYLDHSTAGLFIKGIAFSVGKDSSAF